MRAVGLTYSKWPARANPMRLHVLRFKSMRGAR